MNKKIEKLIYKSLDGALSKNEADILEKELQESVNLRNEYKLIKETRKMVSENAVFSFEPFFEERVLQKMNEPEAKETNGIFEINLIPLTFRKIALAALIVLAILITYNLNSGNNYSIENLLGISHTNIEYAFNPINIYVGQEK